MTGGWAAPSETEYDVDETPLANPDGTPYTGALVVLIPAADDPIVAASSEPAHLTFIWFGDAGEMEARDTPEFPQIDLDALHQEVRNYAADASGPIVVPVRERGTLGDEGADVVFLEPTEALLAFRDGLLQEEQVRSAHDAVEQFPDWTPHLTLGYPERPARADYEGTEVTFDRVALWLGGEHYDYPMGGVVSETITAAGPIDDEDIAVETVDDDELPDDDDEPDDDEELVDEIPIHGVLAPEGVETGDGRGFRPGALSTRNLPLPFRTETVSSHGGNQTSEVVDVGRIDEAWLDEATGMWRFRGVIIMSMAYAPEAVDAIVSGVRRGVSIDADKMSVDMESFSDEAVVEAETNGRRPTTWYRETRVSGLTHVPIPAFEEAYVALGSEFEEDMSEEDIAAAEAALIACGCADPKAASDAAYEAAVAANPELAVPFAAAASGEFAPGTKDGPGWITHPVATSRIRNYWVRGKGAAKIRWGLGSPGGDFNRCRRQLAKYVQNPAWLAGLCANMHKEATGAWPGDARNRGRRGRVASAGAPAGEAAPIMTIVASAATGGREPYPADWFSDPRFDRVTPLTIEKDTRRVYGHLAQWKSCHIGINGACQKPPKSSSGYANFLHGVIDTAAGEQPVGTLTYGIGHADPRLRASAATAHYDQTDAVFAFVNVGEDKHGIWYSGVLRPSVTDDVIDDIRAIGALSGDWRYYPRYGLDLSAAVSVNTPGYSLAASAALEWEGDGGQSAALGLGMVLQEEQPEGETHEQFVARVAQQVRAQMAVEQRQAGLRTRALSARAADLRARAERTF